MAITVPLATLVQVAGIRWSTKENFAAGKGLAGLDEHQVVATIRQPATPMQALSI